MFDWYKIFNKAEFVATGFASKKFTYNLTDRGQVEFTAFQGNEVSVLYDGVFLPVKFLDWNPFKRDGYAVYEDANGDVWWGFEVPEQ